MAVARDASTSRSLLSRIAPLAACNAQADRPVLGKRGVSEETISRSNKRRGGTGECNGYGRRRAPWLTSTGVLEAKATREGWLHTELLQFVDYIAPNKQELEAHQILVAQIGKLFKTRWPDAEVIMFGSSATGLGLTGGDVDLVISFDDIQSMSGLDRKARLADMGDVLKRSGMTTWVNRIFRARAPIITFTTTSELGEVSIDISMRNSEDTGVRAIPIIKKFLEDMPPLRPLILAVKALLSLRDLNDASQGTLSSYAITLMCINFLQRNPTGRPKEQLDDPYATKSLGSLLLDFFQYYGYDFPYLTHYVSVSDRDVLPRKLKSWEIKRSNPAILAVQCMLNPENNITGGCSKVSLIIGAFREALDVMQNVTVRDGGSLLAHIFEIPDEDEKRRVSIDNSVDSGAFLRFATACSAEINARTISGGVLLANQSDRQGKIQSYSGPSLLMRMGPGPMQVSAHGSPIQTGQQMPVLRWKHDPGHHQSGPSVPNIQFNFLSQPPHYQHANRISRRQTERGSTPHQKLYPPHHSYGYHNDRFSNNTSHARFTK